jgi:hypothetical protein
MATTRHHPILVLTDGANSPIVHSLGNDVFRGDLGAAIAHGKWWSSTRPDRSCMILLPDAPEARFYLAQAGEPAE